MVDFEIDVAPFDRYGLEVDRRLDSELFAAANDLAEQAEADARALLTVQVYDAPISKSGYERTRKLLDSVRGYAAKIDKGFEVGVEAFGGAQGRLYAAPVETGTLSSYVRQEAILERARNSNLAEPLEYAQGAKGMRARPYATPAIAQAERNLTEAVLSAVEKAASP